MSFPCSQYSRNALQKALKQRKVEREAAAKREAKRVRLEAQQARQAEMRLRKDGAMAKKMSAVPKSAPHKPTKVCQQFARPAEMDTSSDESDDSSSSVSSFNEDDYDTSKLEELLIKKRQNDHALNEAAANLRESLEEINRLFPAKRSRLASISNASVVPQPCSLSAPFQRYNEALNDRFYTALRNCRQRAVEQRQRLQDMKPDIDKMAAIFNTASTVKLMPVGTPVVSQHKELVQKYKSAERNRIIDRVNESRKNTEEQQKSLQNLLNFTSAPTYQMNNGRQPLPQAASLKKPLVPVDRLKMESMDARKKEAMENRKREAEAGTWFLLSEGRDLVISLETGHDIASA